MKNRLVFRILGALASALIIVSVFIPFISVKGYSQSLWEANELINALYLPIMMIVFGAVGVLTFSTNIKTELAYASSGALLFYIITQVIPIIDEGMFNTLSVGFYCLVTGTILTGIMTFICNLKVKVKIQPENLKEENVPVEQESMLTQIDKLYNDQVTNNNDGMLEINQIDSLPIQPLGQETLVQPLSIQSIEPLDQTTVNDITPLESNVSQTSLNTAQVEQNDLTSGVQGDNNSNINPFMIDSINHESSQELAAPVAIQQPVEQTKSIQPLEQSIPVDTVIEPINKQENSSVDINPVTAEFEQPQPSIDEVPAMPAVPAENAQSQVVHAPVTTNPVTSEFAQPQPSTEVSPGMPVAPANPVTSEFAQPQPSTEVSPGMPVAPANPVTAEFAQPQPSTEVSPGMPVAPANPVTSEFAQPQASTEVSLGMPVAPANPVTAEFGGVAPVNNEVAIQPLGSNDDVLIQPLSSSESTVNVMADPAPKKNADLDIFG